MKHVKAIAAAAAITVLVVACSSSSDDANTTTGADSGAPGIDLGGSPTTKPSDGGSTPTPSTTTDAGDAGTTDDGAVAVPPYVTKVVSFTPGQCAGFGSDQMPNIVFGPPQGGGNAKGSLDVVSLGLGGTIILSLEPNAIVDGPGVDFLVYENAFFVGGNTATDPYAEPGEVSVSDDGVTWATFPCTATAPPWGACAGWHAVQPAATTSLDPANGGDPFDLADVGLTQARFVRIVDKTQGETCSATQGPNTDGFDLDAIGAVHSARVE